MSKHTKSCGRFTKTFLKPILWPFLQIFPCQKSTGRGKMRINEEKIIFSKFPHTIWWITCLLRICQSFKEKYENLQQLELKTSAYSVFVYIRPILYVRWSIIYLHISQQPSSSSHCAITKDSSVREYFSSLSNRVTINYLNSLRGIALHEQHETHSRYIADQGNREDVLNFIFNCI